MKTKLLASALILSFLLPLAGCSSMLERSYESSADHVDYSVIEDESILRVENYQGLVSAILYFVNEHASSGTIRLYNYTGDVEADLVNACDEVLYEDPLGAYALRSIRYDTARILTYYEVELYASYRHSREDVSAIRAVNGVSGLRRELSRMVSERAQRAVLRVSYFSGDTGYIDQLFHLALFSDPCANVLPEIPLAASTYPETGSQRIVELSVTWPAKTLLERQTQGLGEAWDALIQAAPPAGEGYTVEELAGLLRSQARTPDPEGSISALDALSGEGVSDTGLLLAMEYLCQRAGIEVSPVLGTQGAPLWLIVATDRGYRHLLPQYLYPDPDPASQEAAPALYTDTELLEMGYAWNHSLHPVCADYAAQTPEE